ncbi:MAG: hypothetical protein C0434_01995 [Xanthomonadaceae bacterium]|nr:hypothetical protein [Xanthomonadaceae bacterium]
MTLPLRSLAAALSLLLLLATVGCSTGLKLAYDNLERLALWEVDSEIDLDDAQKAAFRDEFRALHQWHRQTQLPLYAADLRALADAIDGNADLGAAIIAMLGKAEAHGKQLWERAQPGAERLLTRLGDAQVTAYDARQRTAIDEEAREHADDSLEDRRKLWLREWRNSLDRWIGKLNDRQRALLDAAWISEQPQLRTPAEHAAARLARHQRLIAGLATRSEPGLTDRLIAAADPRERARSDAAQARERVLLARLLDAADTRQRDRLKATVRELADDFERLSRRGASVASAAP